MPTAILANPSRGAAEAIRGLLNKSPDVLEWGSLQEAIDTLDCIPTSENREEAGHVLEALERACDLCDVTTEEEYLVARALASLVTGTWCSVFNRNLGDDVFGRVDRLFNALQQKRYRYTQRQKTKDPVLACVSRYAVCGSYFRGVDHQRVLAWLNERGVLRKRFRRDGSVELFVIGLAAKVGDNTFTIDRRGRDHRQYVHVVAMQAFPVSMPTASYDGPLPSSFYGAVPVLDEELYHVTYFGDGKGLSRRLPFREEKTRRVLVELGFAGSGLL